MPPHTSPRASARGLSGRFAALIPLIALLSLLPLLVLAPASPVRAADDPRDVNLIASHSGLCLEAEGSSPQPGVRVLQADCTGQLGAVWRVQESSAGGGSVNIVNVNSGLCMEVETPVGGLGALLRQAVCAGQTAASFLLVDRTTHVWIQPMGANPRRCLQVAGGSHTAGAVVTPADCYGQSGTAFHQRKPAVGNDPAREPKPPTPVTERVNLTPVGAQSGGLGGVNADESSISADGRYVAFETVAGDLVPGDTNNAWDVFVRDRVNGTTERISVSSAGKQGNSHSDRPTISADGRYVVFQSEASTLVPGDDNTAYDVFVRDRQTGQTERVSVPNSVPQAYGSSGSPSMSPDGRYVVFDSIAPNLVANDTNGRNDVFLRDRMTGTTTRISLTGSGVQGNADSQHPAVSADGRFVAFRSTASNLVPGDTNAVDDVFVRDLQKNTTERVSVSSAGVPGDDNSHQPSISSDGRHVAFHSKATNLLADGADRNGRGDVFVRDRQTGTTERVSVGAGGTEANLVSSGASISADGRYVTFTSLAATLVPYDTNSAYDVFVRDRLLGTTVRVSVNDAGIQGDDDSSSAEVSADGRFVVFHSLAANLVPGDTNADNDLFVRPRPTA